MKMNIFMISVEILLKRANNISLYTNNCIINIGNNLITYRGVSLYELSRNIEKIRVLSI